LIHFIKAGELALNAFVNGEKERKIVEALAENNSLGEVYASLNGEVSYTEIKMVIAHQAWQKKQ
jgi:hypothetical protein